MTSTLFTAGDEQAEKVETQVDGGLPARGRVRGRDAESTGPDIENIQYMFVTASTLYHHRVFLSACLFQPSVLRRETVFSPFKKT